VFKEKLFEKVETGRANYKTDLQETITARTDYRDTIVLRKEKEKALTDLLASEKIDLATLTSAIEAAKATLVSDRII